ncbi:MAG: tetratricopeptide repeat protein [Phycisphaerales bacterium]|nr:tetratricopeptide repeat protein [Phycisphaerales bacterium]
MLRQTASRSVFLLCAVMIGPAVLAEPGVPAASVRTMLDVDWYEPDERSSYYRAHGIWDDEDLVTDDHRLEAALVIGDFRDDTLLTEQVSPWLAGQWMAARGELEESLMRLESSDDPRRHLLRGDILMDLGREDEARAAWEAMRPADSSASRTDAITAVRRLAELDLAQAGTYGQLMQAYASVRDVAPLDWTSKLQEAYLLKEKYNPAQAYQAVQEVLALNPRYGEAWLLLGRLALMQFNFDGAVMIASSLRDLSADHPMADIIEGEALLMQKDPHGALRLARKARLQLPNWKEAMILELAALAVLDDPDLEPMMGRFESMYPGSPMAAYGTGSVLSFQRQYPESDRWLRRAIEIRPGWSAPWIDLGLLQWQDARMDDAVQSLRRARELDNYNRRAKNSLEVLEELSSYETYETPHFLVRYKPGIDELLVREMLPRLESVYTDTVEAFGSEPDRKTVIEIYPDHERFAIRIIGMPDIHTVAACTGPCIAMEAPRKGVPSKNMAIYDWERVLRHEFAHTVNLAQTDYRVPLWLTEGAAVWMEPGPRKWETSQMLAEELQAGTLLEMDELTWAFARPRRPQDRSLAYAQSNWMLEFLIERWGDDSVQVLMEGIRTGQGFPSALRGVTGLDVPAFRDQFLEWAHAQVKSWGLDPEPSLAILLRGEDAEMAAKERQAAEYAHYIRGLQDAVGRPERDGEKPPQMLAMAAPAGIDDDTLLEELLESHPDHPDVLEAALSRVLAGGQIPGIAPIDLARTYIEIRPLDPLGHMVLARLLEQQDKPGQAVDALAVLVDQEEYDPMVARRLSRALRLSERFQEGADVMERSVGISPYDPQLREEAAAAAIEAGAMEAALRHMEALVVLEPDEPRHDRRLQALKAMMAK